MDPENSSGPRDLSENNNGNSVKVDFNETNWNCVTSKAFLACYFEHLKEEEENRDGTIRSKPEDEKKLTCSIDEYQQSAPILMESTWHEQLCKCDDCLKMYQDHNVEFLFGIKTIECLPTEIILMIFTQLSASDRRFASESCKRFLEIWLCDDFINDRRLVFDCCVLDQYQEPLSVFMKSSRNYHSLAFGRVDIRNVSTFLAKFAQTVATIEFLESSRHCSLDKIIWYLRQLPNLKLVNVETGTFFKVPRNLELLAISNGSWSALNFVHELDPKYFVNASDSFRIELNVEIPAEQNLTLTGSRRNQIQRINLAFQANINVKLPRFENLKQLELRFEMYCSLRTEDILENMEERFPALEHLSIKTRRLPHKNWSCLKSLETLNIPRTELSRLKIFENLTELILGVCTSMKTFSNCFFVHEKFLNKNLKTLKIDFINKMACLTCFKTMTKAFPNLEHLTINCKITNGHLRKLATNTPKLKYLSLRRKPHDPSLSLQYLPNLTELVFDIDWSTISATMIETWPLMLNLRKFIFQIPRFDAKTVKLFEKIPAVEVLDIRVKDIDGDDIDGDHMLLFEAMAKSLKRLRKFRFMDSKFSRYDYPQFVDVFAVNCKYLQHIDFFSLDEVEDLLPKIKHPTLRSINQQPLFKLKSQTK